MTSRDIATLNELPFEKTAYIGYCPICNNADRLLFELQYKDGLYVRCIECKREWKKEIN